MPQEISFNGKIKLVATEQELIEFVNKIREAGGADVIDALFPSYKSEPKSCLIARALNFQCEVNGTNKPHSWARDYPELIGLYMTTARWLESNNYIWVMKVHHGSEFQSINKAEEIAEKLNLPRVENELLLPEPIGNAAEAFDDGRAFQEFVIDEAE